MPSIKYSKKTNCIEGRIQKRKCQKSQAMHGDIMRIKYSVNNNNSISKGKQLLNNKMGLFIYGEKEYSNSSD